MRAKARNTRIRNRLLRRLTPILSRNVPWAGPAIGPLVVGDRHGLPLGSLGLEVLLLREAHGPGDLGQDLLLLAEVLLDAFEEVWDQVVATLELDVDLAVRFLGLVLAPHEPVVGDDGEDNECHQNDYQDDRRNAQLVPPRTVSAGTLLYIYVVGGIEFRGMLDGAG